MYWISSAILSFCFFLQCYSYRHIVYKKIEVKQGAIRGEVYETENGIQAEAYRGIPYAEPPLPVRKSSWRGTRDALNDSSICYQVHQQISKIKHIPQSEDCLYLNVFTPNSSIRSDTLPVLVWIHGGSWTSGYANSDINVDVLTENFLSRGIIFVSVNYRLGALGFMHNMHDETANYGLWDVLMSLSWIKRNIQKFGGDPNNITLMGQSSGAASVGLIALTKRSKGLVHRAIIISGFISSDWATHRMGKYGLDSDRLVGFYKAIFDPEHKANLNSLEALGLYNLQFFNECKATVGSEDTERKCRKLRECLKDNSAESERAFDCVKKYANFSNKIIRDALIYLDFPRLYVDKDLVELPADDLIQQARMPIMIGVMKHEWGNRPETFYDLPPNSTLNANEVKRLLGKCVRRTFNKLDFESKVESRLEPLVDEVFRRYFKFDDEDEKHHATEIMNQFRKIESDLQMVSPCQKEIDVYALNNQPVYAFSFDYIPQGVVNYQEDSPRNNMLLE
ncbi:hypothetical protein WR25_19953 [Diploscapter pachys]|uniref:Carboxylic ester hydrolase n=1 Tax=Diploscapter pachys TaxID=2018661 RepID=A0A2A2KAR1_9BILA|nr:hypothetical protein WR25_19953 [Diploscapter pachys]